MVGISVGFVAHGVTTWHDIVTAKKHPVAFSHLELLILRSAEVCDEEIGNYSYQTADKWEIGEVRRHARAIWLPIYRESLLGEMQSLHCVSGGLEVVSGADGGWVLRCASTPEVVLLRCVATVMFRLRKNVLRKRTTTRKQRRGESARRLRLGLENGIYLATPESQPTS